MLRRKTNTIESQLIGDHRVTLMHARDRQYRVVACRVRPGAPVIEGRIHFLETNELIARKSVAVTVFNQLVAHYRQRPAVVVGPRTMIETRRPRPTLQATHADRMAILMAARRRSR